MHFEELYLITKYNFSPASSLKSFYSRDFSALCPCISQKNATPGSFYSLQLLYVATSLKYVYFLEP